MEGTLPRVLWCVEEMGEMNTKKLIKFLNEVVANIGFDPESMGKLTEIKGILEDYQKGYDFGYKQGRVDADMDADRLVHVPVKPQPQPDEELVKKIMDVVYSYSSYVGFTQNDARAEIRKLLKGEK